jgi:hypothetical protein
VLERFGEHVRIRARLACLLSVAPLEALQGEGPLEEALAASPERILHARIRAGDEAVQRHRDVDDDLSQRAQARSRRIETAATIGYPPT